MKRGWEKESGIDSAAMVDSNVVSEIGSSRKKYFLNNWGQKRSGYKHFFPNKFI